MCVCVCVRERECVCLLDRQKEPCLVIVVIPQRGKRKLKNAELLENNFLLTSPSPFTLFVRLTQTHMTERKNKHTNREKDKKIKRKEERREKRERERKN